MYVRKTQDVWEIETNWGYGWESEYQATTREEAKSIYNDYKNNSEGRFSVRLIKHRQKI